MTRDEKGRFIKGGPPGPGRPPKASEEEYREAVNTVITLDRFVKMIEAQAKRADRGELPAFAALVKLMGLDVQKVENQHDGEVVIKIIYERVQPKTS